MKITALATCMVAVLTLWAPWVSACTCRLPPSATAAVEASDLAFAGWVLGLEIVPPDGKHPTLYRAIIHETHHWKGPVLKRVEVWAPRGKAACGMSLELMQFVVVYGRREKGSGRYSTGWCERSHQVGEYDDFTILRPKARIVGSPPSL